MADHVRALPGCVLSDTAHRQISLGGGLELATELAVELAAIEESTRCISSPSAARRASARSLWPTARRAESQPSAHRSSRRSPADRSFSSVRAHATKRSGRVCRLTDRPLARDPGLERLANSVGRRPGAAGLHGQGRPVTQRAEPRRSLYRPHSQANAAVGRPCSRGRATRSACSQGRARDPEAGHATRVRRAGGDGGDDGGASFGALAAGCRISVSWRK